MNPSNQIQQNFDLPTPPIGAPVAPELRQLAEALGIMVDWQDAQGQACSVAAPVLQAIISNMGLPCQDVAQCEAGLAHIAREDAASIPPPLVTALRDATVHIAWPDDGSTGQNYVLRFEGGGELSGQAVRDADGTMSLPGVDILGYHRLTLGIYELTLAIAPPRCYGIEDALRSHYSTQLRTTPTAAAGAQAKPVIATDPAHARLWALAVQVYALRDDAARATGIGNFSTLAAYCKAAAAGGAAGLTINPMHAGFAADPSRYSPYAPSSRIFLNPLYVDPAAIFGVAAVHAAQQALSLEAEQARLEALSEIDWPAVAHNQYAILRYLFERRVQLLEPSRLTEFVRFCNAGGKALFYHAVFEMLQQRRTLDGPIEADWRNWPSAWRNPDSTTILALAAHHHDDVEFHQFLQWLAAHGLDAAHQAALAAGMPLGLIADLAIGTDPSGSHAWSCQDEIFADLSAGAPPDLYNPQGQNWGIAVFSPRGLQRQGFRAFIDMLRAVLAHAGGLRIDHALGLARLWLVPEGAPPDQGAYLHYPMEQMLHLIALESWRARAIVIGENLGTVPAGFNQILANHQLLGISVLWFERVSAEAAAAFRAPAQWNPAMIATTTTHDLPTLAGWWSGHDLDWRMRLGWLDDPAVRQAALHARQQDRAALWRALSVANLVVGECPSPESLQAHDAALAFVARAPTQLVSIPLEDLLACREQPNIPGTITAHPNWRRRCVQALPHSLTHEDVARRIALINQARSVAT